MNQKAYGIALKILLNRPHFEAELRNKLLAKNISEQDIEPIIEDLKKRKYINDDDQIALYINELSRKGFGPFHIANKIAQKGIDFEKAQSFVGRNVSKDAEKENMLKLIQKKRINVKNLYDIKQRKKVYDFLRRKGFSSELILEMMG